MFATAAAAYFGGGTAGEAWAAGLEQTPAGLVPPFELEARQDGIAAVHAQTRWAEWRAIALPTLRVKGERGFLPQAEADQMSATNPNARMVVIEDAGHDVHLDATEQLAIAISTFIERAQSPTA